MVDFLSILQQSDAESEERQAIAEQTQYQAISNRLALEAARKAAQRAPQSQGGGNQPGPGPDRTPNGGGSNGSGGSNGGGGNAGGSALGGDGYMGRPQSRLSAFLKGISEQESGGNYDAVGVQTAYGTAYGKYQILDSNFVGSGGWDKDVLGKEITLQQYMNKPKLQEKLAQGKLSYYFRKYGARGAAKSWYAGEGNHDTNSDSPQYGGPSINDYASSVVNHMRDYLRRARS